MMQAEEKHTLTVNPLTTTVWFHIYKGKSTRPYSIIKRFRSWCTVNFCFASLLRHIFERMSNRQMKVRGDHAPCCVPNGLDVWPAFKFSITHFTLIYLLEWPALSFALKIYHCTHTYTSQKVSFTPNWLHTHTQRHIQADVPSNWELVFKLHECMCVSIQRWAESRGGKQESG